MTRMFTSITPEEIDDTFERCPDCGTYAVQITNSHYCTTQFTSDLSDAERDQRIAGDPYSADETVAIVDQFVGDAFVYHELDEDNRSLCTLHTDNPLTYCTRAEAQDDEHAPCELCQRLREKRKAEQ